MIYIGHGALMLLDELDTFAVVCPLLLVRSGLAQMTNTLDTPFDEKRYAVAAGQTIFISQNGCEK